MDPQFVTFRRFDDPALAAQLTALLVDNGIEYEVEENSLIGNPLMVSGGEASTEYAIKVKQADFDKVNDLLIAEEEKAIDDVDPDYYLFAFTDDELRDILFKADEWSTFDFVLARRLLKERGITITDAQIADIKQERIEELKRPEESQTMWVMIGYVCALIGGLLGIFIGWMMWQFKKTLPNGERVYAYTESDRKHGKQIFFIGIVVFIMAAIYKIKYDYNF